MKNKVKLEEYQTFLTNYNKAGLCTECLSSDKLELFQVKKVVVF